tara:strand:+ start:799 stop:2826 length:2028 start_codon:yes stop_codon:yes gene_type:complete
VIAIINLRNFSSEADAYGPASLKLWAVAFLSLVALQCLLRVGLFTSNFELTQISSLMEIVESFLMGLRFDLRMAAYAALPLILAPILRFRIYMVFCRVWLTTFTLGYVFFAIVELEFYREFQQRLNGLVFQYLSEDPRTVIAMLWHGLPVIRYLLAFSVVAALILYGVIRLFRQYRFAEALPRSMPVVSVVCVVAMFMVSVMSVRGTMRTGPPLRWGDAYVTDNLFLNHLALNGSFTLIKAWLNRKDEAANGKWMQLDTSVAETRTKQLLFLNADESTASLQRPIGRVSENVRTIGAMPKNVIVILMESFAATHVGSMGGKLNVTPSFDALTHRGILFERFFSNGTHTHQGMFATLSCFPNLPGHEYLMQQPEGRHHFSGLSKLLPDYQKLFVYNGDFSWDNQKGFFANQGFENFIGRNDYINPKHVDPVWGVSDEDMFNRGLLELDGLDRDKPFFAVLQTLSNHLPYSLPDPLPIEPVMENGELSERLTAMKYADWALGQFMASLQQRPYFEDTLVVLVGDHGFGTDRQLTGVNLIRFHVPLLFISPYLSEQAGTVISTVGSQVDIVPTIAGLLGRTVDHQCWGRDLFNLPIDDAGFAIIKPSGSEPTMAMVSGNNILTYEPDSGSRLYQYELGPSAHANPEINGLRETEMRTSLQSYVQTALKGLESNRMGSE